MKVRDDIATSLSIQQDDLDDVPFNQSGGIGRACDKLPAILVELNSRFAA